MTFEEFIMQARSMGASDIHLTVGAPTVIRVNGELCKFTELSDQLFQFFRQSRRSCLPRART